MKIKQIKLFGVLMTIVAMAISCTNLEIEQTDSRFETLAGGFTGVDPTSGLENLYNSVRSLYGTQENLYALEEVSSDELIVPTRGTDWGDNGVWRTLAAHNWSTTHSHVKNTWNALNQLIFNATAVIDSRSNPSTSQAAEAKFIRAFAMFWLIDLYGQVPFRAPDDGPEVSPMVMNRSEAFDYAMNDLTEALPNLATSGPSADLNKASKAAARLLMAKMLLNKHIYTGSGTASAADMTQVVSLVDAITADGFALQDGYFDIFTDSVDSETIFYTTADTGSKIWSTLHYNQNAPDNTGGGWNGFTTLAEFYDLFEGDPNINVPGSGQEERRGFVPTDGSHYGIGYGFLIGQQYEDDGTPLKDRTGNLLVFTKELPGLLGNNEKTGIRVIKYHPENGSFAAHQVIFRYADAYLMKAEAIMRGGTSGDNAFTMVNNLRSIRHTASPLASLSDQSMLEERGREFYEEYWRRNDMIRFGNFTQPWEFKDNTEDFRVLFPIPATAVITNPNLVQNPGY
ncbi:MAG: RagB/SusD family nutrient uptake outer membrane protein [Flavobacteriaceae bacterium]|nr:RagB/SusD family nutrient uptake outer membrane protein [Flavobacteriaceae bacterium]